MKRLFAIGLSLLMLVGFSADAVAMSDADKQKYRAWVKEDRSKAAALAVDDSGCWASSRGFGTGQAKSYALQHCASTCKSKTCKILDVNGKSDFIKNQTSSSTASSSGSTTKPKEKAKLEPKTKPTPVTPKTSQPCSELICGKWRFTCCGGLTWQVEVIRSSNSMWEFESRITDPGNKTRFGFKRGQTESRFNKISDVEYAGEIVYRSILFSAYYPYQIALQTENMISSFAQGPGRSDSIYGQRIGQAPKATKPKQVGGSGTGFFVSSNGLIVTNHHVIKGATKILVTVPTGEQLKAQVISKSTSTDLAVLKIDYETDNYLNFASPGAADIGDAVFTLGFPTPHILGKEIKYSEGVINSLSGLQGDSTYFQTSVPIQRGNSGEPLVNQDGDVVGIVTASAAVEAFYQATGSLPQNVNWAVKGAYASLILPSRIKKGERTTVNPVKNTKNSVVFIEVK